MTVVVNGISAEPKPEHVDTEEIKKAVPGEKEGCFTYTHTWTSNNKTLTLTFKTRILVNKTLNGKEMKDVLAHESTHFKDFTTIAMKLKRDLEAVVKRNGNPEMEERLDWFDYDYSCAASAFHRRIGREPFLTLSPNSKRPGH